MDCLDFIRNYCKEKGYNYSVKELNFLTENHKETYDTYLKLKNQELITIDINGEQYIVKYEINPKSDTIVSYNVYNKIYTVENIDGFLTKIKQYIDMYFEFK